MYAKRHAKRYIVSFHNPFAGIFKHQVVTNWQKQNSYDAKYVLVLFLRQMPSASRGVMFDHCYQNLIMAPIEFLIRGGVRE